MQIARHDARQPADARVLAAVHVCGDDACFRIDQRIAEWDAQASRNSRRSAVNMGQRQGSVQQMQHIIVDNVTVATNVSTAGEFAKEVIVGIPGAKTRARSTAGWYD